MGGESNELEGGSGEDGRVGGDGTGSQSQVDVNFLAAELSVGPPGLVVDTLV